MSNLTPCELLGQVAHRHLRGTPTAVDENYEASIRAGLQG